MAAPFRYCFSVGLWDLSESLFYPKEIVEWCCGHMQTREQFAMKGMTVDFRNEMGETCEAEAKGLVYKSLQIYTSLRGSGPEDVYLASSQAAKHDGKFVASQVLVCWSSACNSTLRNRCFAHALLVFCSHEPLQRDVPTWTMGCLTSDFLSFKSLKHGFVMISHGRVAFRV